MIFFYRGQAPSSAEATELSAKAQATATELSAKAQQTATELSAKAQATATELSARAQATATELSAKAGGVGEGGTFVPLVSILCPSFSDAFFSRIKLNHARKCGEFWKKIWQKLMDGS